MKDDMDFSNTWEYVKDKDSILFTASLSDRKIECLISSEAIQNFFNDGSNEGKPKAFESNRGEINKIAENKIRSGKFSGENEIFIVQSDCEAHGLKSAI